MKFKDLTRGIYALQLEKVYFIYKLDIYFHIFCYCKIILEN